MDHWKIPVCLVNALQVTAEVTALSERFTAKVAFVGPLCRVFAEVITQVAALAKDRHAAFIFASIVEFEPVAFFVSDLKNLILVSSNSFEQFVRNLFFDTFQDYRLRLKILLNFFVLYDFGLIDLVCCSISCLNITN